MVGIFPASHVMYILHVWKVKAHLTLVVLIASHLKNAVDMVAYPIIYIFTGFHTSK